MENVETTSLPNVSTQCSFPLNNEDFVGFKEDMKQIIQKLTGGTKERDVISIVGMAGLGKTTLARKVYSNHSIAGHFDVQAFCTISQTYNTRKLLAEILKQATGDKRDIKEDEDFADLLRRTLVGRRYLIVLDDIWKYTTWEDLQLCFPREMKRVGNYCKRKYSNARAVLLSYRRQDLKLPKLPETVRDCLL